MPSENTRLASSTSTDLNTRLDAPVTDRYFVARLFALNAMVARLVTVIAVPSAMANVDATRINVVRGQQFDPMDLSGPSSSNCSD